MQEIDDVRRWAMHRTTGIVRLLLRVEGYVVDVDGALQTQRYDYAALQAHWLVITALSVASLQRGGEVQSELGDVGFDGFVGLDDELVLSSLRLAAEPLSFEDDRSARSWFGRLQAFVARIESDLELGESLPRLRSSESQFASLAVARQWIELCAYLGVPLAPVTGSESALGGASLDSTSGSAAGR